MCSTLSAQCSGQEREPLSPDSVHLACLSPTSLPSVVELSRYACTKHVGEKPWRDHFAGFIKTHQLPPATKFFVSPRVLVTHPIQSWISTPWQGLMIRLQPSQVPANPSLGICFQEARDVELSHPSTPNFKPHSCIPANPQACDQSGHFSFRPTSSLKVSWSFHPVRLSIRASDSTAQESCSYSPLSLLWQLLNLTLTCYPSPHTLSG